MKLASQKKTILISAPLGILLTPLLRRLGRWNVLEVDNIKAREFDFFGARLILFKSGFGREYASENTHAAYKLFQPDHILFLGVAGGLKPDYSVGEPFYIASSAEWAADSEMLSIDQALGLRSTFESTDMPLLSEVKGGSRVRRARLLTVDSFVNSVREKRKLGIAGFDLVDMEFAAVAKLFPDEEKSRLSGLMVVSDSMHQGFPAFKPSMTMGAGARNLPPRLKLNMNKAAQSLGSFAHLWIRRLIQGEDEA